MADRERKNGLREHICGKITDEVVRWGLFIALAPYVMICVMLDVLGIKSFGRWE